ncbi:MAG: hypothetical protein I3J02_01655 [Prevotella sp.]|nr:hypothetical protein [Prevotella sp.]
MKSKNIIIMTLLALTLLSACKGLNPRPAYPPTPETLALREKYWDKIVGEWSHESLVDSTKDTKIYEHYHLYASGKMTGEVRMGTNDSISFSWQECVTGKDGTVCKPKQTGMFRYIINDTISGRWGLKAGEEGDNDHLIIYADENTSGNDHHNNPDAFTKSQYVTIHNFSFCNGEQLFITNYVHQEASFRRGHVAPTF